MFDKYRTVFGKSKIVNDVNFALWQITSGILLN